MFYFHAQRITVETTQVIFLKICRLTAPGPVQFFNATSLSSLIQCNATRVEWIQPTERELNGNISGYQLHWKETNGEVNELTIVIHPFTPSLSLSSLGFRFQYIIVGRLTKSRLVGNTVTRGTDDSSSYLVSPVRLTRRFFARQRCWLNYMYNVMWALCGCPAVIFNSCNNLRLSVHAYDLTAFCQFKN